MKYFASKISENLAETPEGYLLALNVPIGRVGEMEYGKDEVPLEADSNGMVTVSRDADELFSEEAIASFQGKPLTIRHPNDFVSPENWSQLSKGVMQNVRRGSGDTKDDLVCDLLITDGFTISLVKSGLRGLSCGYEAEYTQTGVGLGKQTRIRGNHLALVEEGRAGQEYAVRDHKGAESMDKKFLERLKKAMGMGKTFDEAVKDAETAPTNSEPAVMDSKQYDELVNGMKKINDALEKLSAGKSADEEKPDEKKDDKSKDEDKDKDKEESKDEDGSLEERLKALEVAVGKLLEAKAGDEEEESEDEESDVIEDEDDGEESEDESEEEAEDEEVEITGDTKSRAEILCPGIALTKDVKVKALKAAYATKDGKLAINKLTGGKSPSFDDAGKVEMLFVAASEMIGAGRQRSLSKSKGYRRTSDFQSNDQDGAMTPEKMNELNEQRYNPKK